MKKLGKLSLSELKTGMSQISENEANGLKGGTYQINGSTWYSLLEYHDLALAGQWNGWNHVLGLKGTVGPYMSQVNDKNQLTYDNEELSPDEALKLYYGGLGVRYFNNVSGVVVPGSGYTYLNYGSGSFAGSYAGSAYGSSGTQLEPSVFQMGGNFGSDNIGSCVVGDDVHNFTQTLMDRFNHAKSLLMLSYTNDQLRNMTFEFDGLKLYAYQNLNGSSHGAFIAEVNGEILPI